MRFINVLLTYLLTYSKLLWWKPLGNELKTETDISLSGQLVKTVLLSCDLVGGQGWLCHQRAANWGRSRRYWCISQLCGMLCVLYSSLSHSFNTLCENLLYVWFSMRTHGAFKIIQDWLWPVAYVTVIDPAMMYNN